MEKEDEEGLDSINKRNQKKKSTVEGGERRRRAKSMKVSRFLRVDYEKLQALLTWKVTGTKDSDLQGWLMSGARSRHFEF